MSDRFNQEKLDKIVADAHANRDKRSLGYREQALKLYPWICGRCAREFTRTNLSELTVHHRDHDHDNNPSDGSNWELLCLFCHDNEHQRYIENSGNNPASPESDKKSQASHNPFANLKDMLKK
ncbi:MAG: YajD family HNH nuclease [Gammaproteobacteria bacterium]|nr:YajD family HNH nuclease [Gammaproteobacteria bacterium]